MQIAPIGSANTPQYSTAAATSTGKIGQSFQKLGSALASGNLADAKEALAQMRANTPVQAGKASGPIGTAMAALNKAVNAGDLKAAQQAYGDLKQAVSQAAPAGNGQASDAVHASEKEEKKAGRASGGSSSSRVFNKKDTNKDGVVSSTEERAYDLKHPTLSAGASVAVRGERTGSRVNTTV